MKEENKMESMNELKEKRGNLLLALGEEAHKTLRLGSDISEKMKQLSNQIKEVDIKINRMSNPVDYTVCPQCQHKLSQEEAFCGECGFAVKQFYAAFDAKCICCKSLIKSTQQFCNVCGTRQRNAESEEIKMDQQA